ncbi:Cdc6/Cdc18 family protein [Halopenitus salinus]|uniref:ORC1-type DNA replication protein n=1 Tax=Halopenitus salinus TaxID=1198295 RepID=A0ABD5UWI0_9EURY
MGQNDTTQGEAIDETGSNSSTRKDPSTAQSGSDPVEDLDEQDEEQDDERDGEADARDGDDDERDDDGDVTSGVIDDATTDADDDVPGDDDVLTDVHTKTIPNTGVNDDAETNTNPNAETNVIPDSAGNPKPSETGRSIGADVDSPDPSSRDRSSPDVDLDGVVLDDEDGDEQTQGLFDDLLSGEPIFENKEVLRPSYTPRELPHRNDQINRMATILVSALRGETPSNILIYGKTGTGKTASAKFVSNELESTSTKYEVPCDVQYINCEVTDTQYRVLAQLANEFIEQNEAVIDDRIEELRELRSRLEDDSDPVDDRFDSTADAASASDSAPDDGVTSGDSTSTDSTPVDSVSTDSASSDAADPSGPIAGSEFDDVEAIEDRIAELEDDAADMEEVPMTGWPTDRVYSTFFEAVDYRERVVVIMLDEIDKLVEKSGDDTLYNLSRMNSELDNSRISIMGISNDLKFTDFLDPRVKSSLGEEEIVFPPYDANQLRDILQHRADVAFKPDALTDDVIPLCAAFAAQEHGDARRALDLLRTAGELAERSQAEIVGEEHVRQAQDKIELDRVVEVVRTLPTQSKIVLFSIILLEKNGVHNINTGEVFNIYKRLCEEIDADVLTQRRVTDLISELDMLGIVNAVVVSKGRYGRTKEMSLSVPLEETEAVLLSDSRLGDIENAQPFVQARFDN